MCYRAIAGLVTYFVVGGVVNYKVKGARGSEVVPNVFFWKELPILIKVIIHKIIISLQK